MTIITAPKVGALGELRGVQTREIEVVCAVRNRDSQFRHLWIFSKSNYAVIYQLEFSLGYSHFTSVFQTVVSRVSDRVVTSLPPM